MAISIGDKIPDFTFGYLGPDGPAQMTTEELFAGKRIVLFAVPGAFTPTCNHNHLPGYITHADEIISKGVDAIAVVSVNDMFVMNSWAQQSGGKDKIHFLADGSAGFTKAVGLEIDLTEMGMGVRSKRYSMLVEDGKVVALNIEDTPKEAVESGAEKMLEML